MIIKDLGLVDYQATCDAMRIFTAQRDQHTQDELWLVEHPPVFTQGLNGKDEHVLNSGDIPVIRTDRGGQVTYHGPGQLIAYTLFDLKRLNIGVREMVSRMENSVISMLDDMAIKANARADAPGVYVEQRKIAALGLRVKQGSCYHGLSINISMDLAPFSYINPCGYKGMEVVDLKCLGYDMTMSQAKQQFLSAFEAQMFKVNK
ncbi:MAG: lipoyl(octanoyl) transferase LipB [Pseudomonadota bacterium]|nr:lipoyl(octanoyl) transferase LipB [Pseudomonadota bacterium]MDO7666972.1 lipoyl(octanoyl) transferase LipB [Pseudomonadota bacterium]MDO7711833.1 lipoyl(octanoyl) transferase LipB [Pseudomonadota bacterium]